MLYEARCGERPEGAFAPLRRRRPEVPSAVDRLVLQLLQPDPAHRLASAGAARAALHLALRPAPLYGRRLPWAAAAFVLLAEKRRNGDGKGFRSRSTPLPSCSLCSSVSPCLSRPMRAPNTLKGLRHEGSLPTATTAAPCCPEWGALQWRRYGPPPCCRGCSYLLSYAGGASAAGGRG